MTAQNKKRTKQRIRILPLILGGVIWVSILAFASGYSNNFSNSSEAAIFLLASFFLGFGFFVLGLCFACPAEEKNDDTK